MIATKKEAVLKFRGLKFIVPMQTECFWPYYGICFVGEYDLILEDIEGTDIVLDAGANIGIFTLLASRSARRVIAVEPDPENFDYLVRNVKLNHVKNVILVNKALSDYIGRGYISGRGLSAALSQQGIPVEVTTIDVMLSELHIKNIDVVKMDIEGGELEALNGQFLHNVRELMVEIHDEESYQAIYDKLTMSFAVQEWGFSSSKVLKRILSNLGSFMDAEVKTGFVATTLFLKYMLGLSAHPVPAAKESSKIRLLFASRRAHSRYLRQFEWTSSS